MTYETMKKNSSKFYKRSKVLKSGFNQDRIGYQLWNRGGGMDGMDRSRRSLRGIYENKLEAEHNSNPWTEKDIPAIVINPADVLSKLRNNLTHDEKFALSLVNPNEAIEYLTMLK